MGWFSDNFRGSVAEKHRTIFTRGAIVYAILMSGLVYLYSPMLNRLKNELAEGRKIKEPAYFVEKKKNFQQFGFGKIPTKEQALDEQRHREQLARQDFAGPLASEETIRKISGLK